MKKTLTLLLGCIGLLTASAQTGQGIRATQMQDPHFSGPTTLTLSTGNGMRGDVSPTRMADAVASTFPNSGWSSQTSLPSGRWATSPVFVKPCVSGTDTGYVYLISGGDASFANTTANVAYNVVTGTWVNKAPIPTSRTQITPIQVKNKIYVIGGYAGSFSPVTNNDIYDVVTNTWTTGAVLPTAVGDYASGVYNDSLIYIIGGYTGSGDANNVQVYNVNTNTWAAGTAKAGTAVAGARAGIIGNSIVHVGGYSQTLATELATTQLGIINPANPLSISWIAAPNYPAGAAGRLGAGVLPESDGRVYFGGGDPNGAGTAVLNNVYAFNTLSNQWETGPTMITGVSNISSFAGVIKQDTLYMVTMGGYNGTSVTAVNEWLKIGPATVPTVQANAAICPGGSATLVAANGTAYSWSPAGTLSDATIANPVATPTVTTTYTVNISQHMGCTVPKNVTVTVNPLPTVLVSAANSVCQGASTALSASGGVTYSWLPAADLDNSAVATPVATPAASTTYTVNVTDGNGCSNTNTVMVTVNPLPVADAGSPVTMCAGNSTTLNASGGTAYSWLPAADLDNSAVAAPVATPAASTTYTVNVTDGNGCSNTNTVMVTVNPLPAADAGSPAAVCAGNSTTLNASGGTAYSWLPAADLDNSAIAGPTATPATSTTYTVNVTDLNGCSNTATVAVTVNELPIALAASSNISCNGLTNGTAGVSVSGSSTYSYLWSNAATTASITGLSAGPYSVTVTDDVTSCTTTASFTIAEPTALVLAVINDTSNDCTGTVMVTPTGGTFSYTYTWAPGGETTDAPANLCAGTYTVNVTDANGCTATATADVFSTVSVNEIAMNNSLSVYPNPAKEDLTISGSLTAETSIMLMDVVGKQVMNITENAMGDYKTTVNISALPSGIYFLQLKNKNAVVTKRIVKE